MYSIVHKKSYQVKSLSFVYTSFQQLPFSPHKTVCFEFIILVHTLGSQLIQFFIKCISLFYFIFPSFLFSLEKKNVAEPSFQEYFIMLFQYINLVNKILVVLCAKTDKHFLSFKKMENLHMQIHLFYRVKY